MIYILIAFGIYAVLIRVIICFICLLRFIIRARSLSAPDKIYHTSVQKRIQIKQNTNKIIFIHNLFISVVRVMSPLGSGIYEKLRYF